MMKSFRKSKRLSNSLNSSKHSISRVTSTHAHSEDLSTALKSPEKAIRALYDYKPQGPGELRFEKGDFFHVIQDQAGNNEANGWYEATNPATQQRGMVPMSYFEVFSKTKHSAGHDNHNIEQGNPLNGKLQHVGTHRPANQMLYAVTLFDFQAERDDELNISAGENLVICAHHDFEWFIAKPITRLGGPGLVPVTYVKIIDMMGSSSAGQPASEDAAAVINHYNIPTVEQWKDQTAKYEALTIPLGHISNSQPAVSSNSQYFQPEDASLNRSSLGSTYTYVTEAAVDSYHLEHGRYQYLVVARLSNGRTRYLYRFYQDFYDLQVKLLELFPYEAGKIENSRRIIPSIPGPLINVNDSISKLRREKLDYYLRNLISLPVHISRSEEVLGLFDILDNGFDKEVVEDQSAKRASRPVMRQSNYQQDRHSQYSFLQLNVQRTSVTPSTESLLHRPGSTSSNNLLANPVSTAVTNVTAEKLAKVKVKFYYEDDIFVLLLPVNLHLQDLKTKLIKRLNLETADEGSGVHLLLKNDYDEFLDSNNIASDILKPEQREQLFQLAVNDDDRFQEILYDKCKVMILSG
ncbi:hypothetical protein METBIDRAFT_34738 [Metschnikowia bicuspidata var. bicuspidata NRRL YB-4993]|uniref:Bud emergence protein 1 n=1 Tax=Metschnikowia bicuspidata var. bicuspidata NRRL YB-4993 TaxID=869754 RepID=A0A1A0HJC9_9ASCO|nr:hypothetical protein METBIDRAFT_34738 [Metschnikowia bicuspidata var. bicuspidata NRRL YB-4993]OBA24264.1 hypothetical protein METBIDRAFT_34738 [Metschnikowia bicuspidata var. bicuspidata NRRL YB-4993]